MPNTQQCAVNSLEQSHQWSYLVLNFYTPLAIFFFASMLYDLVISRGEEEIEKPDLTVVFYTDIAASCVPVYANQTWSFLHMILSTGSQSLVNFVPVSPTVFYLHVYPFYVYWSMFFSSHEKDVELWTSNAEIREKNQNNSTDITSVP